MKTKYLDIDLPENGEFSKEQLEVLEVAFHRIDEYLVLKEDTCFLTVYSASEVYMSDELFSLMEQSVRNKNVQYQAYLYFNEHSNLGISIENPFEIQPTIPMSKTETESAWGINWSTTSTKLSHAEVIIVLNELRAANGVIGAFAAGIAGKLGGSVAGGLVTMYAFLNDAKFSKIQDDYVKSGSTAGITLTSSTTYSSTTGISVTQYTASPNK